MRLADEVRVELLFKTTNIVIPIENRYRDEVIKFWENLKSFKGKEVEIYIKVKGIEGRE